jgi:hypothetical protein
MGYYSAAPFGDMMLTGCFGLVAAYQEKMKKIFTTEGTEGTERTENLKVFKDPEKI